LAGVGADLDLCRQARSLVEDLEMARRLQEARLQGTTISDQQHFDWIAKDAAYMAAFQDYGLNVDGLNPLAAAEQIRVRAIHRQLVAALEDWARTRRLMKADGAKQRLAVARAVDPDVLRNRLRDVLEPKDGVNLEEVVAAVPAEDWPVRSLELLGTVASDTSSGERVAALLVQAQQRHPDDFWINFTLGYLLNQLHPSQRAEPIRYYSIAVALRPQSPTAHVNLGISLARNGRVDDAIAEFREAIRLKNDYANAHGNLGVTLDQKGRLEETIDEYREAIRIDKDDPGFHLGLANALRKKGRLEESIAELREAIRLNTNYGEAHFNLALTLDQTGRHEEAIAEYREAVRVNTNNAKAHNNIGVVLAKKGHLDDAIAEYRKATLADPTYALAYINLGEALDDGGRPDEANAAYDEAIQVNKNNARVNKDNPEAHFRLGSALAKKGRKDEAMVAYREAIRVNRDHGEAHNRLGACLAEKGKAEEAIYEFREAIRVNDNDAEAHYHLGTALMHKGQLDQAIAKFHKAISIKKDYAEAHCNLGHILFKQGHFAEALREIKQGHEIGSKDSRWPYRSEQWVRTAELFVALESKLPTILKGEAQPADADESIMLAQMCQMYKGLYAAAARFYAEAFMAQPRLAEKLGSEGSRYDAACAAALAGCGQGKDADQTDDKERARLRQQALSWLQADLAAWQRVLKPQADKAGPLVREKMQHWLHDTDFTGVRDPDALAKLPEAESQEWQRLWRAVKNLRQRAEKQ
jgi:tetratricopeptide (TPR) repeat protein